MIIDCKNKKKSIIFLLQKIEIKQKFCWLFLVKFRIFLLCTDHFKKEEVYRIRRRQECFKYIQT